MAKFAYNNAKNTISNDTSFEFNYGYYFSTFYKKDINLHYQSKSADELANELRQLMTAYRENFHYIQELQK